jgi:hypothetical protein
MNCVKQFSNVVLPEPVPPDTMVLRRQWPTICSSLAPAGEIEPKFISLSSVRRSRLNLRMVRVQPSSDSGGAITLTREPSIKRASQIGLASSTRRPTAETMRWQMFISCC